MKKFLRSLFETEINEDIDLLSELPVKFGGLAFPNPTKTFQSNREASALVTSHLHSAIMGTEVFAPGTHVLIRAESRNALERKHKDEYEKSFATITSKMEPQDKMHN